MENLHFNTKFVDCLPGDPVEENYRREVVGACYSFVKPKKNKGPHLIASSKEVANLLDINAESCQTDLFTDIFSGNKMVDGMKPYAMCYGGHQFGNWAGQLGDGRAINLGEIINSRNESWTIQLKGSGETPYSRNADGLAVLRSSVREFLCSEAMFHLGIPTTRALSLIGTGEEVMRDMFYDGNPKLEPGAVVCRVAPNFLRFGNFELLASRRDNDLLDKLVEFTVRNYFKDIEPPSTLTEEKKIIWYSDWFTEVCRRSAMLMSQWMHFGFVHGVMNTDNMSISGLTIDYGPYGWLEGYDPMWTPNTTDAQGKRYCYGRQPDIALWNLAQLANALLTIIPDEEALRRGLNYYRETYAMYWREGMVKKLGFEQIEKEDDVLIEELLSVLSSVETDWTLFFRLLAKFDLDEEIPRIDQIIRTIEPALYSSVEGNSEYLNLLLDWFQKYRARGVRSAITKGKRAALMNSVNPKFVLRNYLVQIAIEKASEGDFSTINELLDVVRQPYSEQCDQEENYGRKRPEWARRKAGCSMLSCSS